MLARADTRNLTRSWMVAHVPRGARIVLEPVVLASWIEQGGGSSARRWEKYPSLQVGDRARRQRSRHRARHSVALEDYETTLSPALIGWYERQGYCWVVSGSTESGRALADPRAAPLAVAYYRALACAGRSRLSRLAVLAGLTSTRVQLRLDLRLLPALLHAPGP